MAIQKREYELSIWTETLNTDGTKSEQKIGVIGAHDMTYDGRATLIKLQTKSNGTHNLTFQMPDKYFDNKLGDFVQNEFKDWVTNERKVKLHYKNEWFEFFIKNEKLNKKYKSYMRDYICTDAYIDELARNGYGITFDTELYNNVEEIGTFTEEIIDGTQWEYHAENNTGDFTEFLEERLFRIPVKQFTSINGYKLKFDIESDKVIHNVYTDEERPMEMGDDLARIENYFWDNYSDDNGFELIGDSNLVEGIENDGYIYVPYSQLNFCYVTSGENGNDTNNFIPATEEAVSDTIDGVTSYLLSPPTIDPNGLIQFIALPKGCEVHIDESGLILNKEYSYVMTVKQWNELVAKNWWYIFEQYSDKSGTKYKEITKDNENHSFYGNKVVVYEGYLEDINGTEVRNGKRFFISDRSEINISEEVDQYVTVYKNKSSEYSVDGLYTNDDWYGGTSDYRVCSKIATRQIIPQLARNYIQNGYNFKNTSGWEVMKYNDELGVTSASIKIIGLSDNGQVSEAQDTNKTALQLTKMTGATGSDTDYNTIINFGAIGQQKTIEKDKVYCIGAKLPSNQYGVQHIDIIIAEGEIKGQGEYVIKDGEENNKIVISFSSEKYSDDGSFCLIRPTKTIKNPYIFIKDGLTSRTYPLYFEELYLFEAYTKGIDFFPAQGEEPGGYYKYSGRDVMLNESNASLIQKLGQQSYYKSGIFTGKEIKNRVLFEKDVLAGDTYEYKRYFIQQLKTKEEEPQAYDTFMAKTYTSPDKFSEEGLPLNAADYSEDDYDIITNYIDLNQCKYYLGNVGAADCDCNLNGGQLCMYQKYGYCPYRFQTEKHCRRTRTLNGSKSNRFNLTQEVSKIFEVYPMYYLEHEVNGAIKKDEDGKPIKKIFYVTEKGVENKVGFRYEKNLSSISRTIASDQIVTKLYVEDVDSELSRTSLCSIKTALDNPSKDSFIIDFSYYIAKGMLDKDQVMRDLYGIDKDNNSFAFLKKLGYYNGEYDKLTNKITNLQNQSFTELEANVLVNLTGIETAQKELYKIQKQMDKYKGKMTSTSDADNNDTYLNYVEKYKEQQEILMGLVNDTFYTEGICSIDDVDAKDFLGNHSIIDIKEDYYTNHNLICLTGMLGQYCVQYQQIKEWKKERAKYLKDINTISELFFKRYEPYLKEGTWSDSNYLTDEAYYHDAVAVAAEGAIPKVSYDISVVPLGILNEDYEIGVCDTTYVEDIGMFGVSQITGLPNRLKVIISELNEDLDVPSNDTIRVQNFTTQFEDLFEQVTASIQSLSFNENIYKRASNFTATQNVQTDSLQGTLDANNLTLLNTSEENIKLDAQGQAGSNINNHNNKYKLTGEGLFFSTDGGESWSVGVSPDGINADYIKAGTLDASRIRIIDGQYLYFLWDKSGITAYREPKKVDNDTIFGGDYARFNKYGLSLVEGNKVRLRSGYAYSGTEGTANAEDPSTIGREIGFFLYDDNGRPIFSTSALDSNTARLNLTGEMFIHSSLRDPSQIKYKYTGRYQWRNPDKYFYIKGEEETETEGIEPTTTQVYITSGNTATITTLYSRNSDYFMKDGTKYYHILKDDRNILQQVSYQPDTTITRTTRGTLQTNIWLFNSSNNTLTKRDLYYISSQSNYYYEQEEEIDTPGEDKPDAIGIYINNTDSSTDTHKGTYYRRLFSCIKKGETEDSWNNVFSVLADGSLYIGGKVSEYNGQSTTLSDIKDFIKIESLDDEHPGLKLTPDGEILLGTEDLVKSLEEQIADLAEKALNAAVPSHRHNIDNIGLIGKNLTNIEYTPSKEVFASPSAGHNISRHYALNTEVIYPSLLNSSSDRPRNLTQYYLMAIPDGENFNDLPPIPINIKDLINLIAQHLQTAEDKTEFFGQSGGRQPDTTDNPTIHTGNEVVDAAYQVVKAHYNNMMNNGLYGNYYSQGLYFDTTINGIHINSRRDCSGLIMGIWQYMQDVQYGFDGWTGSMLNGHPNNWSVIWLSDINYDVGRLKPGDVLVNTTTHTEMVSRIVGSTVYTYSLGDDDPLYRSYNNTNLLSYGIGFYNFILRRNGI